MNKYIINISDFTRLVRVNKRTARQLFDHDLPVMFCPVNLAPDNKFMPGTWQRKNTNDNYDNFTSRVNSYEYYNCQCPDTGYYTAFYAPYCMTDKSGNRLPFHYGNIYYNLTYDTKYAMEV